LSEYQVAQAMTAVLREMDHLLTTYSLAPCWDDDLPYYGLFVERGDLASSAQGLRLVQRLDRHLQQENMEYAAKRHDGRVGLIPKHFEEKLSHVLIGIIKGPACSLLQVLQDSADLFPGRVQAEFLQSVVDAVVTAVLAQDQAHGTGADHFGQEGQVNGWI